MMENGLEMAPHKSEAVVLTTKRKYRDPVLYLNGHHIPVRSEMRYLGVHLDSKLTFGAHTRIVSAAARKTVSALARLMPNIGGPSSGRRRLLMSVAHSKLLYAAPIWASRVASRESGRSALSQTQRGAAIKVARCYRTVSDMAALVLARIPPAHLISLERARIEERKRNGSLADTKRHERATTILEWQRLWDRTPKGRWTRKLIPDLERWLFQSRLKSVSFHMAQALTWNGCFQSYLFDKKRALDPRCKYCACMDDTVEHTLVDCPHWEEARSELRKLLGRPLVITDIPELILGPDQRQLPPDAATRNRIIETADARRLAFCSMVESVIGKKEEDERIRLALGVW